jgi:EAL domain-containing protein (putative c-di-GMP-specific phosphodiesterase class I)
MRKNKLTWTATNGAGEEAGVRRLTREQITVVFQPIVDIVSGRAFAFEALTRCKHPDYPSPVDLFEAAVKEGACGRLGRTIREVAFATCGEVPLFVNIHPAELSSRWLVMPDDPLAFHGKPVYLEITESSALTHFELCVSVLRELARRTGVHVVVDDFGAGHSNLERVVDLEPAVIKLDLRLTRDIARQTSKQVVVRHMVHMANELGAIVIAEGVETADELHCLRDLGVRYGQGYLLARPAAPPPKHAWPPAEPPRQSISKRPTAPSPKRTRSTKPAPR